MKKLFTLAVILMTCILSFAQSRSVRGTVKDEKGDPVPFATVTETGTNNSVQADANGVFTITIRNGNSLTATASGHQGQTLTISGDSVSFVLPAGGNQMTEVVVTALGQTRSKAKVGYSTSTFNTETINRAAPVSALDGLAGKVPGADISKVGGPGSSEKVVLRGYGVIAGGGNQPLYVIDGVPITDARFGSASGNLDFGNGASDINPNDIETISILRGTAATSLYGSQARNGAILINTKRGRSGKLKVEYAGSANFSSVSKLPDFQSIFGQGWNGTFILSENGSWGPRLDGQNRLWGSVVDNSQLIKPFSFVKNNLRDFYELGREYNNTISLSGGGENNQFYFSYGNVSSDGVVPSDIDSYYRNTLALRTNSRFQNFSINTSFNYINKKLNVPFTGQPTSDGGSTFEALLQIPVDIPVKDFKDYKNKYFNVDNYFSPYNENPYYPIYQNRNTQNSDRFFGNVDLNYKFTNWLSSQLRVGGDFTNARTFGYKAVNAPNPGSWNAGANVEGAVRTPDVGSVSELTNYAGILNGDFILKFNKNLGSAFNLEALAGVNYNQIDSKGTAASITNLSVPGFYNLSNSTQPPIATDASSKQRYFGVYAQTVLGYREQVYLTLNARNDWASTLPINHNTFFYPGASLSWIASQTFDLNRSVISLLKFRGSYGKTGASPNPYLTNLTLVPGNIGLPFGALNVPFNGVNAFRISNSLANSNLAPIITSEAEIGTEIRLFKNRIGFDIALYDKRTQGQIFAVPIDPSTGYTSLVENLGLIQNKGIELAFDAKPVSLNNLTWTINYTFSKNWNKVLNLNGGPNPAILQTDGYGAELDARPGMSVTSLYAPVPQYTTDGKIIVNPTTGLPQTAANKGLYGDAQYEYMMGLSNTLTYKNWQLGFTLDYRKGGIMYSGTADLSLFVGNSYMTTYNDRRPFIIPNSVVQNGVDANGHPVYVENTTFIDESNTYAYYYYSTNPALSYRYTLIDRSFLKLRDLTLSYRLPQSLASRIRATNLTIGVYGRNFILWTPTSNIYIDPEASNFGNDLTSQIGEFRTTPTSKQFGVTLKANF